MAQKGDHETPLTEFYPFSKARFAARLETRPAHTVMPPHALSKAEPKPPSQPVMLVTLPVILKEPEAGETHLSAAIDHRRWYEFKAHGESHERGAEFAQRFHPDRPVYVLAIDSTELDSSGHVEVLKEYFHFIKPAAQAVPTYDWQTVVERFANDPQKARTFAEVLFNQPAESLTPRQIRTLLGDVVSIDSVQREYKKHRAPADTPPPPDEWALEEATANPQAPPDDLNSPSPDDDWDMTDDDIDW